MAYSNPADYTDPTQAAYPQKATAVRRPPPTVDNPGTPPPGSVLQPYVPPPRNDTSPAGPNPTPNPNQAPPVPASGGVPPGRNKNTPAPPSTLPPYNPGGDPVAAFQAFLAQHPGNVQAAIDAWNASPWAASGLGPAYYAGTNTIGISGNRYLDDTSGSWNVVQKGPEGAPTSPFGALSPQDQALRDALVKQLEANANQSLNINPLTDPTIQMETAPYTAEQTRTARNLESQAAEAGGPNANVQAADRSITEAAGEASGSYSAGLVSNELTARRDQMQQALTSMQGILTAEESTQMQGEIAQLNAAISLQEAQMTAQNQLYQAIANNNYNIWYEQPGNHPTY